MPISYILTIFDNEILSRRVNYVAEQGHTTAYSHFIMETTVETHTEPQEVRSEYKGLRSCIA